MNARPATAALLLLTAGCHRPTGSADDVCSFEFQQDNVDDGGRTIGTRVADAEGAYTIHAALRWPDRVMDAGTAPVAVILQGGWDHEGTPVNADTPHVDTAEGLVDIHLDLPGAGQSGGENDRRGPIAASAVAALLRWVAGEGVDAGGCALADRAPMADPSAIYLIGASNGGNLAMSVLTDDTLDLPPIAGLITWETPAAATFVNVELGNDPSVYAPGSCTYASDAGITCPFPDDELLSVEGSPSLSTVCFDTDADHACSDADVTVHGTEDKTTGLMMLSPMLREAIDARGLPLVGYADTEDADAWWSYRDASRRTDALVASWPELPVLLIGSEEDHVLTTWSDHPHVHGFGQALQASGAFWTRLNPGATWLPANASPNPPDLPLALAGDTATLLTEDEEDPLTDVLTAAVRELADRHASGDWSSD